MLLDELKAYAVAQGVTTPIFKGLLPPSPDACIALHEYPGRDPEAGFGRAGVVRERPRVQVEVRGAPDDYVTPRTVAETLWQLFASITATTLSGTLYLTVWPVQSPYLKDRDANKRVVFGFNLDVHKNRS